MDTQRRGRNRCFVTFSLGIHERLGASGASEQASEGWAAGVGGNWIESIYEREKTKEVEHSPANRKVLSMFKKQQIVWLGQKRHGQWPMSRASPVTAGVNADL